MTPAPWVRCSKCHAVREDPSKDWRDHPAKLPNEVPGMCSSCLNIGIMLAEVKRRREGRELEQKRARGYKGVEPVGDVFKNLRGDKENG